MEVGAINRSVALAVVAAMASVLSACDHAKSASQVARDTAAAEQTAANNAARIQQKADARIASAQGDVRDEQRDLAHVDAVEGQRVADAQAEGDYKVALARCEGLGGATERSCKEQAEADYDVAKARAKQVKASADPKP
jgi:hypothetical protein